MWITRHPLQNADPGAGGTAPPPAAAPAAPAAPPAAPAPPPSPPAPAAAPPAAAPPATPPATSAELAKAQADLVLANAKVAALEADAAIGKSHREATQAQIDAAAATLTPANKALLDSITGLDRKAEFLALVGAAPKPQHAPAPSGGPPVPSTAFNVETVIAEKGADFVRNHHPKEWDAYIAKRAAPSPHARGLLG